ncbi:MAG: hypothetical protein ACEY3J_03135 [Arsenophonus sp.]
MGYIFLSGKIRSYLLGCIIGVSEYAYKELIAVEDGYRELE